MFIDEMINWNLLQNPGWAGKVIATEITSSAMSMELLKLYD